MKTKTNNEKPCLTNNVITKLWLINNININIDYNIDAVNDSDNWNYSDNDSNTLSMRGDNTLSKERWNTDNEAWIRSKLSTISEKADFIKKLSYDNAINKVYHGDCLKVMDELIKKWIKVDAVITDPPYWTTSCAWDSIIPFDQMWERLNKIIKPDWIIVLFWNNPFSSLLISSNINDYRYSWIWDKTSPTWFLNANYKPLNSTEDIIVFSKYKVWSLSKNKIRYNPQWVISINKLKKNNPNSTWRQNKGYWWNWNVLNSNKSYIQEYTNYPKNILQFKRDAKAVHPTQKPVALIEYLIKTYTNEWELVLDFTAWSGTTGVAALNTNRNFILIEKEKKYFDIINKRLNT